MSRTPKQKEGKRLRCWLYQTKDTSITEWRANIYLFLFFTLSGSPVEWLTFLLEKKQTSGLNCKIFGNYYVHRTNAIEGDYSGVFVLFAELFYNVVGLF